jgi:tetratricopeptide (TPR) repeat protein
MQISPSKFLTGTLLVVTLLSTNGCTAQMRKARYAEQAERYFKAGQYDEAKIEYQKLLRIDPRNAVAYSRMGQMWLEEGSPIRAGGFFLTAEKFNPNDIANRVWLARTYSLVGQTAEARKECLSILKQAPDKGEALLILAETSRTPEEYRAAQEQLERFPQRQNVYFQLTTGTLALRKSDLAGAEAAFSQAVSADPKLPQAHAGVALVLLAKKDVARGGEELKTAADLSPIRSIERLNYAQFKMQTRAVDEAKAYLKNLTAQARDFTAAWTLQGRIAFAEKKYDEAEGLLGNVFSRDPDDLEARLLKAQVLLAKADVKGALQVLDRLDKSFPGSPLIKYQLALTYLQDRNPTQAAAELEQLGGASSNFPDAVLLLAELNVQSGKPQAAIEPLVTLLKKRPDLVRAQVLLADVYQALGRPDDAAGIIRQQIKNAPQNPQPYLMLGLILVRQNKTDEARQAFEKSVELDKNNALAIDQLVSLDIANKAFPAARQRVERLLQQNPQSAAAYFMQGKIELAEGKRELSEASLKKALELDPNLVPAYNLLVQSYISSNKMQEALQEINVILARNPKAITALTVSGLVHEKLNEFDKAREDYEKVLALNPNSALALNNLAYIYGQKLNDLGRAAELARKAHDLAPSEPTITDTLGWTLYQQGDYQQAIELLGQSEAKLQQNPEVQYHFGMANYMMGRTDAARTALEKAVAAPAEFAWKDEAKRRLALLSKDGTTPGNLPPAELEKMAKEQSSDPIALVRLGDAYEKQGSAEKAAAAYERAFQANAKLVQPAIKLAQLNAGPLKNSAKALEYAKKARELAPTDPHVTGTVGRVAFQAGNLSWAYNLLQESGRQLPDDPAIAHDLAWAAYSVGRVAEAQQAMQRVANAPAATPEQQDARDFLALTQLDSDDKDPSPSENDVNTALAANNGYVPALMARAAIQMRKGDAKAAVAIYTSVLQQWPDFAPAQKRLAAIYAGDPATADKGYELANKARRILPDDPVLEKTTGILSFQRKDYARSAQLLQESDQKAPLDPLSLFYLGMSRLQLGQKPEGKETLERALAAGIQDPFAQQAKQKLAELEKASPAPSSVGKP